jgi:hypothetical protein
MECELWPQLYEIVVRAGRRMPKVLVRYSDALILLVLLWSGLHDRPLSWGCDLRNWKSTRVKPARLPSDSTVSRRLRSPRIVTLMQSIEADLRGTAPPKLWKILDGKCLLIGSCSKDPDARAGRAVRGLALLRMNVETPHGNRSGRRLDGRVILPCDLQRFGRVGIRILLRRRTGHRAGRRLIGDFDDHGLSGVAHAVKSHFFTDHAVSRRTVWRHSQNGVASGRRVQYRARIERAGNNPAVAPVRATD